MKNTIKDIEINLGRTCNNRCIFCMSSDLYLDSGENLSLKKTLEQIDHFAKKGFNSIGFLGGEPTLHKDLFKITAYAKEKGFSLIHLVSNGRRFADKKYLQQLVAAGIDRFSISIHSHDPSVEDMLTRVPGGFLQKIQGIKNINALYQAKLIKNPLSLNVVINKYNINQLKEYLLFFKKLGCSDFRFNSIRPDGRARERFAELVPTYTRVGEVFVALVKLAKKEKLSIVFEGIPFCVVSTLKGFEKYIGELRDFVNVIVKLSDKEVPKDEVDIFSWKARRKTECKVKTKECPHCMYDEPCEGIWREYVEQLGDTEFKPVFKK